MDGARKDRRHYALLSVRNLNANGRVRCRSYCGGGFCKFFWFKNCEKIKKQRYRQPFFKDSNEDFQSILNDKLFDLNLLVIVLFKMPLNQCMFGKKNLAQYEILCHVIKINQISSISKLRSTKPSKKVTIIPPQSHHCTFAVTQALEPRAHRKWNSRDSNRHQKIQNMRLHALFSRKIVFLCAGRAGSRNVNFIVL